MAPITGIGSLDGNEDDLLLKEVFFFTVGLNDFIPRNCLSKLTNLCAGSLPGSAAQVPSILRLAV